MENINNLLLVSTTSTKHEKLDNFAIKTLEGPFAIQTLHGIPKYFYTYKSKKITINQISPYKTIKTYTYKDEIIDLCFSSCGSYMFVMSSDKILVYNSDKQVAKIHGNFANCKIKSFHRTIVVVGNFNIFVFEQCNTENKFFEMTKDEDFEFGLKHKFIGSDCFVANHSILYSNNNALNMEVLGKFKLTIKYPLPIVKILCKTALSKVYCLCADEKVYKTMLDGTKSVTQIEESDVTDITFSFDEKYIIIGKKRSLHIYETSNDILVDEVFFDKDIEAYDCVLEVETAESLSSIKINK